MAKILVHIDWDALVRGFPVEGEVSEVPGVGPVPVAAVRAMMATGDAFLAAVVTRGVDVATVAHLGRRPTAYQATALEWTNPICSVAGCNVTEGLQTDHRLDWSRSRITLLRLLDRLCAYHHRLKTVEGWALVAGAGKRDFVGPDDSRHPEYRGGAVRVRKQRRPV